MYNEYIDKKKGAHMGSFSYIGQNLARIQEACFQRADTLGVPAPTLLAVTKSATDEEVRALVNEFGQAAIAENRVQMFTARYDLFDDANRPEMHVIGSLQTNKVKYMVDKCALLHSLDSVRLAEEIEKQAAKRDCVLPVLIEVNSGREEAKGGVLPEEAYGFAEKVAVYPHIALRGIMTMAPVLATPEEYRPYFRETAGIYRRLSEEGMLGDAPILSMGMSDSYEVAIEEGATIIRVGRALFRNEE